MDTMTIQSEVLRATMRQWVTGVTVVTSAYDGEYAGMTVSSFTSVSLEPPTVLVCLNKNSYCHSVVHKSGIFAISLLSVGQENLSKRFAGLDSTVTDKFDGVEVIVGETGAPLLVGAIGHLDCVVRSTHDTSTHTIFIAELVYVDVNVDKPPLVYYNRNYHLLTPIEATTKL
jgi:flavin reductase (DIM6/NTAB) family NADH-FMN oxidoreductase RutF